MQENTTPHSLLLMEGRTLKSEILANIHSQLQKINSTAPPCLAIVLIGDDASSLVYIKQKVNTGKEIGILVKLIHLPTDITEEDAIKQMQKLNNDTHIHGIILQLPIPSNLHAAKIMESIDPKKDVDGFHPFNIGRFSMGERPYFYSATPLATLKLLQYYKIPIKGQNIVILNRSNIVGKPLASFLGSKTSYGNATVTICHSYTKQLEYFTKNADILISATSIPRFIDSHMIKDQAVLVDLGQFVEEKNGKRYIIGDFHFDSIKSKAKAITPVPGGVGPMTVAMLIENIFKAFVEQTNLRKEIRYDFF